MKPDSAIAPQPIRKHYRPIERKTSLEDRAFKGTPRVLPVLDELVSQPPKAIEGMPEGYDPRLAYAMAVISAWSYSDGQTLANKLEWYGLPGNVVHELVIVNSALLVEAKAYFVRSRSGRVGVVSFAGTEPNSVIDLLTDGNVFPQAFGFEREDAVVHAGFHASVEALWDDVSEQLALARDGLSDGDSELAPGQRLEALYLTGHSLGGAMAVIAAATLLRHEGWRKLLRGVYTYGQPAVGNAAFASLCAQRFGERLYRHVYRSDIVPQVPPRECGEFCHFGHALVWNETRGAWRPAIPEIKPTVVTPVRSVLLWITAVAAISAVMRRMPRGIGRFARTPLPYSLDDHMPANYIETSRAALQPPVERSAAAEPAEPRGGLLSFLQVVRRSNGKQRMPPQPAAPAP